MKKLIVVIGVGVVLGMVGTVQAATVTNTVSWATEPAEVQVYKVRKQVQVGGNTNAPWTNLPDIPAGTKQFVDVGSPTNVNVCYEVQPTNNRPSVGIPATACSLLIPPVGNMTTIVVSPSLVP